MLITVSKMLCVKAQMISTRLLSKQDKQDMLNGLISPEQLLVATKVWIDNGMPDYANGQIRPYNSFYKE